MLRWYPDRDSAASLYLGSVTIGYVTPARFVSVEEYLGMTGKPNLEYRDGVVTPKDRLPGDPEPSVDREAVGLPADETPQLCCEILSEDTRIGAALEKCEQYHACGVPYCWIIDPNGGSLWEYPRDGEPARVVDTLRAGNLQVDVTGA